MEFVCLEMAGKDRKEEETLPRIPSQSTAKPARQQQLLGGPNQSFPLDPVDTLSTQKETEPGRLKKEKLGINPLQGKIKIHDLFE